VVVVVAAEDKPKHEEGDIAGPVIKRIETWTLFAHFPLGFVKVAA